MYSIYARQKNSTREDRNINKSKNKKS